jgi:hypothetical protein
MANLPISGLPTASALDGTELLPFVQGGVTTQANVQDILNADLPLTSSGIVVSGPIVPSVPSGLSLGTAESPFRELYVSSGSINIASDVPGDPNTSLSNEGGNILVSAGGMRLIEPGNSFIAETGSFQYQTGSLVYEGVENFTGSLNLTGSLTLGPNTPLNINNGFYVDGNKQFNYGAFSSTLTQSGSADTILSMSFNTTDVGGYGVSITNGTQITVANNGLYNLQFSAQLDRTTSGTNIATIWFAYTGSDVVNSATDVTITGNAATNPVVAAWNYILPMISGSYVEIYWSHDDNVDDKVELKAVAPRINPTRPAVPSIIATLTQVA